jgi:hypothetical protein
MQHRLKPQVCFFFSFSLSTDDYLLIAYEHQHQQQQQQQQQGAQNMTPSQAPDMIFFLFFSFY